MARRRSDNSVEELPQKKPRLSSQRSQSLSPPRMSSSRHSLNLRRSQRLSRPTLLSSPISRSAPSRLQETQLHLSSTSSGRSEPSTFRLDDNIDEETDPLLYRIFSGLEYVHSQNSRAQPIMQTTRFSLRKRDHLHPGSALDVLRQAHRAGYATRISVSHSGEDPSEVWEIGVPRPNWVAEGTFPILHDPQWWYGKSDAEIKAGPHAEEEDVKRAIANLKKVDTRRKNRVKKTKREMETDRKLTEGLRRQRLKLNMDGDAIERRDETDSETNSLGSDNSDTETAPHSNSSSSSNSDSTSDSDDDEPLMERLRRMRRESISRVLHTRTRPRVRSQISSGQSNSASSSESSIYIPTSSSASSLHSSDEGSEELLDTKRHKLNHVVTRKPADRANRHFQPNTEQSSEEDDMPIKRGIRQPRARTIGKRRRASGEEETSTDDEEDNMPIKRGVSRTKRGPRVISHETDSSESR